MHSRHPPCTAGPVHMQDSKLQLQEMHGKNNLRRQTLETVVFFTSRMRGLWPPLTLGPPHEEIRLRRVNQITGGRAQQAEVLLRTDEVVIDASPLDPHPQDSHGEAFLVAQKEMNHWPRRYAGATLEPSVFCFDALVYMYIHQYINT